MKWRLLLIIPCGFPGLLRSQNTGIGTTTPQSSLHVVSPNSEVLRLEADRPYVSLYHNGAFSGYVWKSPNSIELGSAAGTNQPVTLAPDGVQRVFINPDGKIGIGTSNPLQQLQVEGGTFINGFVGIQNATPNAPLSFPPALGKKITLYPGATGDVGFAVQGNLFQIYADHPGADIAFGYDQSNIFFERMRIRANGNVGIGTAAPTQKLDIDGLIRIRQGGPGYNKILVSDESGNASWADINVVYTGNVGFGPWGPGMDNLAGYNPIGDNTGGPNQQFGYSVAIDGEFAVVGSPFSESVNVFRYNGSQWIFLQELIDPANSGDWFGHSVDISGSFIIVGAPLDDIGSFNDQGSASVYHFNGTNWVFLQKLNDVTGSAMDGFGSSVSISGNNLVIGAPYETVSSVNENGTISIYQFNGSAWTLKQKTTYLSGFNAGKHFGYSVCISGDRIIVGAPSEDVVTGSTDHGSVNLYHYNGSNWVMVQHIIHPPPVSGGDRFGHSVAIEGDYALVGIPNNDAVSADAGAASFFRFDGSTWNSLQTLYDNTGTSVYFGRSVCLSGDIALVGCPYASVSPFGNNGTTTIYQRVGSAWQSFQYTKDAAANSFDYFGSSVAFDALNRRFIIGAPGFGSFTGKAILGRLR